MNCPKCGLRIKADDTEHGCGWTKNKTVSGNRPTLQTLKQDLQTAAIDIFERKGKPISGATAVEMGDKWIYLYFKPGGFDNPREITNKAGSHWRWDYGDQVIAHFKKYVSLPAKDRNIIQDARGEGIYWRGDELVFFKTVINETKKMREIGIAKYQPECVSRIKSIAGRMMVRDIGKPIDHFGETRSEYIQRVEAGIKGMVL